MTTSLKNMAIAAKKAAFEMAQATAQQKNEALEILQEELDKGTDAYFHGYRDAIEHVFGIDIEIQNGKVREQKGA